MATIEEDRARLEVLKNAGNLSIPQMFELKQLAERDQTSGALSDAALDAGDIRAEAGERGLEFLDPFRDQFSEQNIADLNALATDSETQMNFLQNNPLFEALKSEARENTFRTQSAGGSLGSSGTDEILQNKFLMGGNDLINQQINRQMPLLTGAQNAAGGSANLAASIGESTASGLEDSVQAQVTGIIAERNRRNSQSNPFMEVAGLTSSFFTPIDIIERRKDNGY